MSVGNRFIDYKRGERIKNLHNSMNLKIVAEGLCTLVL